MFRISFWLTPVLATHAKRNQSQRTLASELQKGSCITKAKGETKQASPLPQSAPHWTRTCTGAWISLFKSSSKTAWKTRGHAKIKIKIKPDPRRPKRRSTAVKALPDKSWRLHQAGARVKQKNRRKCSVLPANSAAFPLSTAPPPREETQHAVLIKKIILKKTFRMHLNAYKKTQADGGVFCPIAFYPQQPGTESF